MRKFVQNFLAILLIASAMSCAKQEEAPAPNNPGPPTFSKFGTPSNFLVTPLDGAVVLSFLPVENATSYNIYLSDTENVGAGTKIKSLVSPVNTAANNITIKQLDNGTTYYFAVSAVGSTETPMTLVQSATPSASLEGRDLKTVSARVQVCFSEKKILTFENGEIRMSFESFDSIPLGENDGGCDGIEHGFQLVVEDILDSGLSGVFEFDQQPAFGSTIDLITASGVLSDMDPELPIVLHAKSDGSGSVLPVFQNCSAVQFGGQQASAGIYNENQLIFNAVDASTNGACDKEATIKFTDKKELVFDMSYYKKL